MLRVLQFYHFDIFYQVKADTFRHGLMMADPLAFQQIRLNLIRVAFVKENEQDQD
jgi:hypothetical protein